MKKKLLSAALAVSMLLTVAVGCSSQNSPSGSQKTPGGTNSTGSGASTSGQSGFTQQYTWSLSTGYATGSPMVDAYNLFAEKLNEYSEGAITLNVYADSSLMGENDTFLALKSGDIEFGGYGPSPVYLYSEELGFLLAPFFVPDYESYQNLYNSDIFEQAKEVWRTQYNTRDVAGQAYRGYRNTSSATPINSAADLNGVKLRLNDNQIWIDSWKALGATPVAIALGELYTSLQNGAATASEGPWEQMDTYALYEVQDYIIETRHICECVGIWMSESLYQSLPQNYQEVIDKAGKEAIDYLTAEAQAREEVYFQDLLDHGCTYIEPDLSGFQAQAKESWDQYFASTWTTTTYDELQAIMAGN